MRTIFYFPTTKIYQLFCHLYQLSSLVATDEVSLVYLKASSIFVTALTYTDFSLLHPASTSPHLWGHSQCIPGCLLWPIFLDPCFMQLQHYFCLPFIYNQCCNSWPLFQSIPVGILPPYQMILPKPPTTTILQNLSLHLPAVLVYRWLFISTHLSTNIYWLLTTQEHWLSCWGCKGKKK